MMDKRILVVVDAYVQAMKQTAQYKNLPRGKKNQFAKTYSPFNVDVQAAMIDYLAWCDSKKINPVWYFKAYHRHRAGKFIKIDALKNRSFYKRYLENSLGAYEAEQSRIEVIDTKYNPVELNDVWETSKRIFQHNKIMCMISNTGGFTKASDFCINCDSGSKAKCLAHLEARHPKIFKMRVKAKLIQKINH